MKFKKKRSVNKGGGLPPLCFGIMLNALLFPLFTLLLSAFIYSRPDPASLTAIGSLASYLLCAAVAAFVISKKYAPKGAMVALCSSVIFVLSLLIVGLIFTGGKVGVGVFINHILYAVTAALFGFIGSKGRERVRSRRR
ncbi:MAG: TIGR04086 family membrane protein [Clostridia bacterium]|nr:TIGR04086 family membrane protein [Clostridia bacterium]